MHPLGAEILKDSQTNNNTQIDFSIWALKGFNAVLVGLERFQSYSCYSTFSWFTDIAQRGKNKRITDNKRWGNARFKVRESRGVGAYLPRPRPRVSTYLPRRLWRAPRLWLSFSLFGGEEPDCHSGRVRLLGWMRSLRSPAPHLKPGGIDFL